MKKLSLLVLIPTLLSGELSTSSISSDNASYDGNALVLSGSVELDHSLGKMASGSARLVREDFDGPFSAIHLNNDVKILLKERGKVECDVANFDFENMTGTLSSTPEKTIAISDLSHNLLMTCRGASVSLKQAYDELKITEISTDSPVEVVYGKDFILKADSATYEGESSPAIKASPNCVLTHFNDVIYAEKVGLFPTASKVVLKKPKGQLSPTLFSEEAAISFSSDKLIWDQKPHVLTLSGRTQIEDQGVGTLESEEEIEMRQQLRDDRWVVTHITTRGTTSLSYQGGSLNEHHLVSHGGMALDGDRFLLTAQRSEDLPVTYYHDSMILEADSAQLSYSQDGDHIATKRLLLLGNIRLISDNDHLRCAVAERVIYHPETQEVILKAKEGERVLFWDEQQHLSISAKEVHIHQTEKGEKVKGVGNVSFTFSSTESDLLKKLFPFYQPQGGN